MEYKKKAHSVYLMTYHLVFVTKYRKPVISDEIGDFMKILCSEICKEHGGELISAESDTDHLHLLISMPPQERPSDVIRVLKTQTSKKIHLNVDAAYTEDGEHFIDLPGDTTVSMNFWGFSPLYLRELAQRFPAFLDENLPRNPLKCEYFVPSIVDAQLHAGTADVTMLHTDDAWHGVTYHDDLPDVVAALRALRDAGKYPDNIW